MCTTGASDMKNVRMVWHCITVITTFISVVFIGNMLSTKYLQKRILCNSWPQRSRATDNLQLCSTDPSLLVLFKLVRLKRFFIFCKFYKIICNKPPYKLHTYLRILEEMFNLVLNAYHNLYTLTICVQYR